LKGKPVGEHEDIGFEQIFASPDNAYFLGVSNRGLVQPAYVIFDRNGRILKAQPHDPRKVHYFAMSVTLIRKWYDSEKPDPRFDVVDGKLKDVSINGCDGKQVCLLIREDLDLRAFLLEDLFKRHAKQNETCYVAFGRQREEKARKVIYIDPPTGFLERFKNRPFAVQPASKYPWQDAEIQNNPRTGVPDGVYTVEIVEWLGEDTAKVRAEMFRHGLWARGQEVIVEKKEGQWRIKQHGAVWVS
jgi:hypothetical protein